MDITIRWTRLGTINEYYWNSSEENEADKGPFLYCGMVKLTQNVFDRIISNDRLTIEYNRIKKILSDEDFYGDTAFIKSGNEFEYGRRWFYFRNFIEQSKLDEYYLLYIGKVGVQRFLSTRLFLNEDPIITFPTFYLQLDQSDIILYRGSIINSTDERVNSAEKCTIFYHKPPLNLHYMTEIPEITEPVRIINQFEDCRPKPRLIEEFIIFSNNPPTQQLIKRKNE